MSALNEFVKSITSAWIGMSEIKVNPQDLLNQSNEVVNKRNIISQSFSHIDQIVNGTAAYWNGEASDAFRGVYAEYGDDISEIISRLDEHVVDLKKMAGVYSQAESANVEIADSLSDSVIL